MVLQKNIPQPGDLISVSQGDLLKNSQYWVETLGKDHQIIDGHNSGSFEGGHLQVSLIDQGDPNFGSPNFPVSGADIMLWGTGGALYWRNHSVNPGVQMTRNFNPTSATRGATFLPGGLILNWGQDTGKTDDSFNFVKPFTTAFIVTATINENSSGRRFLWVKSFDNTKFVIASRDSNGTDETQTFSWIAIGN